MHTLYRTSDTGTEIIQATAQAPALNGAARERHPPCAVELPEEDAAVAGVEASPQGVGVKGLAFLRRFHPGPWALACFGPGENEIGPAGTFDPGENLAVAQFIKRCVGSHNVYFTVNCVGASLRRKASKRDIAEIHCLHADVDLDKHLNWSDAEAVAAEKGRVLDKLRSYNPPPTGIIWSGGGYQAYWKLSEIIAVNGDKDLMAPIERRMQRIEKALGADPCHNADRIMRLPGTINVLSKTKIAAGRKPAFAEVVEFHEDRIYDLEDFPEIELSPRHTNGAMRPHNVGRDETDRMRDALRAIPADDYEIYLKVCMAIKSELGDAGFGMAREWAITSVKFDEGEFRRKWASIKPEGGTTVRTLFGMAREHGWRDATKGQPITAIDPDDAEDPVPDVQQWPVLESTAAHGLIGAIAELATRNSEADPVAVMGTGLAWAGAIFGRSRFYRVGDTVHHARLFCALVGETSRARKGTSLGPVQRIFREAEGILRCRSTLPFPAGLPLNVSHGLSSGEGLVAEIRDKRNDEDEGAVEDKRLLVVEGEFGAVLRHFQRQGNTLSTTLRTAWDGWDLGAMTKHNRDRATAPHVCIVGHITGQELNALMTNTDIWNGVANRFLWNAVRRSKKQPFAQPMPDDEVTAIAKELAHVIEYAHSRDRSNAELTMSNSARDHWADYYAELTQDHPGILGAVTSRAEAQALRLAMDYAQLDGAERIELHHLEAALTFWRYSFDSAAYIFKGTEIDPVAQRIVEALASGPKTQTQLHNLFDRNLSRVRLDAALRDLQERGRIMLTEEKTAGRSRRIWSLVS